MVIWHTPNDMGAFPITTAGNILPIGLAIIAFISDRMWRRLPAEHQAVHREEMSSGSAG